MKLSSILDVLSLRAELESDPEITGLSTLHEAGPAQSGATGHIKIADFSRIAARGGVSKNTESGKTYAGFPLLEHQAWLKYQAKLARLAKKTR